jgi:hypothetical protein
VAKLLVRNVNKFLKIISHNANSILMAAVGENKLNFLLKEVTSYDKTGSVNISQKMYYNTSI